MNGSTIEDEDDDDDDDDEADAASEDNIYPNIYPQDVAADSAHGGKKLPAAVKNALMKPALQLPFENFPPTPPHNASVKRIRKYKQGLYLKRMLAPEVYYGYETCPDDIFDELRARQTALAHDIEGLVPTEKDAVKKSLTQQTIDRQPPIQRRDESTIHPKEFYFWYRSNVCPFLYFDEFHYVYLCPACCGGFELTPKQRLHSCFCREAKSFLGSEASASAAAGAAASDLSQRPIKDFLMVSYLVLTVSRKESNSLTIVR